MLEMNEQLLKRSSTTLVPEPTAGLSPENLAQKKQTTIRLEIRRLVNAACDWVRELFTVKRDNAAPDQACEPLSGKRDGAEVECSGESHIVIVEENEISLEKFARRHQTTVNVLRKINPDLRPDTLVLKKNDIMFVPGSGK